jgi:hypothetical protein
MKLSNSFNVVGKVIFGVVGYGGQGVSVQDEYSDDLSHSDEGYWVLGFVGSYLCRVLWSIVLMSRPCGV